MNCPKCGSQDFYQGVFGSNCVNMSCSNFKKGTISGKEIQPSLSNYTNPYPEFELLVPTKLAAISNLPILVYKNNPKIIVLTHCTSTKLNNWFAANVVYLTKYLPTLNRYEIVGVNTNSDNPLDAAMKYIQKHPNHI